MKTKQENLEGTKVRSRLFWFGKWYFKLAILVLLLFFVRKTFFRSEEDQIRELLSDAVSKVQVSATSHPLARAQDIRSLVRYLSDEIEFELDVEGEEHRVIRSRKALEQQALAAKVSLKSLEVLMLPPRVELHGTSATATAEIHVLGSLPDTPGQFYEDHELTIGLEKVSGDWKIRSLHSKNLRGSQGLSK